MMLFTYVDVIKTPHEISVDAVSLLTPKFKRGILIFRHHKKLCEKILQSTRAACGCAKRIYDELFMGQLCSIVAFHSPQKSHTDLRSSLRSLSHTLLMIKRHKNVGSGTNPPKCSLMTGRTIVK
jgi:hypothetical protein